MGLQRHIITQPRGITSIFKSQKCERHLQALVYCNGRKERFNFGFTFFLCNNAQKINHAILSSFSLFFIINKSLKIEPISILSFKHNLNAICRFLNLWFKTLDHSTIESTKKDSYIQPKNYIIQYTCDYLIQFFCPLTMKLYYKVCLTQSLEPCHLVHEYNCAKNMRRTDAQWLAHIFKKMGNASPIRNSPVKNFSPHSNGHAFSSARKKSNSKCLR